MGLSLKIWPLLILLFCKQAIAQKAYQSPINIGNPYPMMIGRSLYISHSIFYPADFKTIHLSPSTVPDHNVKNIMVFEPFVEYRFYKSALLSKNLLDSAFTGKLADIDSNYVIYPNKQSMVRKYLSKQLYRKLRRLSDAPMLSLHEDSARFIKKELDSIMFLAKHVGFKEYDISDKVFNYLKNYKATQCVFLDILVCESNGRPNQSIKFSFFAFDMRTKKIFYYDNKCEYIKILIQASSKDEAYSWMSLPDTSLLKHMLHKYKRYLKPYIKYRNLPT
jgi:hypothetical protein